MSRCEVVSNLKNGLKGREPLRTALVFALLQTAKGCHFKFTDIQVTVCNPTCYIT